MPMRNEAAERPILVQNVPATVQADIRWRTRSSRGMGLAVQAGIDEAFLPLPVAPTALAFPPPLLVKASLAFESNIGHCLVKRLLTDRGEDLLGASVRHHCLMGELEEAVGLLQRMRLPKDAIPESAPPQWTEAMDGLWARALDICGQAAEVARPFTEGLSDSPPVRHVDVLRNIAPMEVAELERAHQHMAPDRLSVPLMSATFAVDPDGSRFQMVTSWPTEDLIGDGGDAGAAFTERFIEEVQLWSNGRFAETVNPSGSAAALPSDPAGLQPLREAVLDACRRAAVIHAIANAWCVGSRLPLKECERALTNLSRVEWTPMLVDVTALLDEPSKSMLRAKLPKRAPKSKRPKGPSP